jgi:hypothetical protein
MDSNDQHEYKKKYIQRNTENYCVVICTKLMARYIIHMLITFYSLFSAPLTCVSSLELSRQVIERNDT